MCDDNSRWYIVSLPKKRSIYDKLVRGRDQLWILKCIGESVDKYGPKASDEVMNGEVMACQIGRCSALEKCAALGHAFFSCRGGSDRVVPRANNHF